MLFSSILAASLLALPAATPAQTDSTPLAVKDTVQAPAVKIFTLEELKKFDGKNANPAYIAVDGIVYDVSNAKGWIQGKHKGYNAGTDVSDIIKKSSPHGTRVLKKNPVIGKLAEPEKKKSKQQK